MPLDVTPQATALIEQILTRFHEGHRRALPELQAMAAAVDASGIDNGLADALCAIGNALELHMFKEEMRLFPMMEQGGNTLIGRLIEDLHREHGAHQDAMDDFRVRLRRLAQNHGANSALQALMEGVDELARELDSHIRTEDEELFALFSLFAMPEAAALRRHPG
jgi:regulator of cell morphogenesis and NO signaling